MFNAHVYRTSGLFINKYNLSSYQLKVLGALKDSITLRIYDYFTDSRIVIQPYFENDVYLSIPRHIDDYFQFFKINKLTIANLKRDLPTYNIDHNIIPRDDIQKQAISALTVSLYNDITLSLPPGKGKTVITIAALCHYNVKSIIIVDTNDIATQWKMRIEEFTNVDNVEVDKNLELKQPFNIVTIQKLTSEFKKNGKALYNHIYKSNVGIVVFDEVHCLIGPSEFSKVCFALVAEKFIGVSATPYRHDESTKLLEWWLGPHKFVRTEKFSVLVKVYSFNSGLTTKQWKYINFSSRTSRTRYLKQLAKSTYFYELVVKVIKELREEGRSLVVFFDRNDMIDKVSEMLNELNLSHTLFYKTNGNEELQSDLILTNYIKCGKAIDAPHIDTVVYATGHTGTNILEQTKGRLQRIHANKKDPLIVDIVDISSSPQYNPARSFVSRYCFYEANEYNVEFETKQHEYYLKSLISQYYGMFAK